MGRPYDVPLINFNIFSSSHNKNFKVLFFTFYLYYHELALFIISVNALMVMTHVGGIGIALNISTIEPELFVNSLKCTCFIAMCLIGIL